MRIKNSKLVGDDGNFVPFKKSPNVGGQLSGGKPKFLVIHYTAGGGASGTVNWFQNPSSKVSAHLVIDRNGDVTQMVPFDTIGQHAGKSRWKGIKGLNSHSIGIELCNWGLLQHAASGAWLNPAAKPVPAERVVLAAHRNSPGEVHGWEVFDGEQFDATVRAAQAIVEEYGYRRPMSSGMTTSRRSGRSIPDPPSRSTAFAPWSSAGRKTTGTTCS
jgi:N-acetylmuramoyl-L-alanine amidase